MGERTNEEWLRELSSTGAEQAAALTDLRALLLRGSLFALRRTMYDLSRLGRDALTDMAEESAQEALLAVLEHLRDFRGESKFTTWAYKFAINVALVHARHESWKWSSLDQLIDDPDRSVPFPDESQGQDPARAAWQEQVREIMRDVIHNELSQRQRQVLIAMVFDDVPIDEVAEHLGTNRNNVYKLLHDARIKLKARLEAHGLLVPEIMDLFAKT